MHSNVPRLLVAARLDVPNIGDFRHRGASFRPSLCIEAPSFHVKRQGDTVARSAPTVQCAERTVAEIRFHDMRTLCPRRSRDRKGHRESQQ